MERQVFDVVGLDFIHVFLIFYAKDNLLHARPAGRQDFFFDTAHGQYLAAQRDFARHSYERLHASLGEDRGH